MEFFKLLTNNFETFIMITAFCCAVPVAIGEGIALIIEQWRKE